MSRDMMKTEDLGDNPEGFAEVDIDPRTLDPNRHYRIISARSARMARATQQKYTPTREDSEEEEGVRSISGNPLTGADGLIHIGDGILMDCPKEAYQERTRKSQKLTSARLKAPEGQFRKRARESSAGLSDEIRIDNSKK